MSYSFPKNQEDGTEIVLENGATYRYNATKKTWEVASAGVSSANGLYTLSSAGNTFTFAEGLATSGMGQNTFCADSNNTKYNLTWHLYNLKDDRGANVWCRDYLPTTDTVFEIWSNSSIMVMTTIKDWKSSRKGSSFIEFNASGPQPTVGNGTYLVDKSQYQLILSNLIKKA